MHNSANILFMVGSAHDSATSFGDWGYADGAVPCLCTSQCVYFHSYNTRKKKGQQNANKVISWCLHTVWESFFLFIFFARASVGAYAKYSKLKQNASISINQKQLVERRKKKLMKNCCREALYVGNEFICAGRHMVACVFDVFLFFHIMRQRICLLVNIIRIRECLIKKNVFINLYILLAMLTFRCLNSPTPSSVKIAFYRSYKFYLPNSQLETCMYVYMTCTADRAICVWQKTFTCRSFQYDILAFVCAVTLTLWMFSEATITATIQFVAQRCSISQRWIMFVNVSKHSTV